MTNTDTFLENRSNDQRPLSIISSSPGKEIDLKGAASKAEYVTIIVILKQLNFSKKKAKEVLKIFKKMLYNKIKNFQD